MKHVLLVDDEVCNLRAYEKLLKSPELRIDTAESFKEAVHHIRKNCYDIVISDLRLHGSIGLEGIDILEVAKDQNPDTGVILVTAYGSTDIKKLAFVLGASCYLEKPVFGQELRQAIERLGIEL